MRLISVWALLWICSKARSRSCVNFRYLGESRSVPCLMAQNVRVVFGIPQGKQMKGVRWHLGPAYPGWHSTLLPSLIMDGIYQPLPILFQPFRKRSSILSFMDVIFVLTVFRIYKFRIGHIHTLTEVISQIYKMLSLWIPLRVEIGF